MILRKKLIAGNWKMNKTATEAVALVQEITAIIGKQTDVDVWCARRSPRSKAWPRARRSTSSSAPEHASRGERRFHRRDSAPMLRAFLRPT